MMLVMSESTSMVKRLTVCLLTYNRMTYAKATLDALFKHLIVPPNWQFNLHIADDGSPADYVGELVDYSLTFFRRAPNVITDSVFITTSNSERGGYGSNFNLAMQTIHANSDYILPLEDDWALAQDLNVGRLTQVFDDIPEIGCIRLGYLSYTQPLYATVVASNNDKYLLLDEESPEPHVFVGHPRLETVEWEKLVGPWPENMQPGDTEFYVACKLARRGIAWPMDLTRSNGDLFKHIGTERSY